MADLDTVLATLRKKHGDALMLDAPPVSVYPTGLKVLDWITGIDGIPAERITELYSPEGCGKSSLCIKLATEVQKTNRIVVWADFEQCFTKEYAVSLGMDVDPSRFVLLRPDFAEVGFDSLLRLLRVKGIGLMVVDSIAAATPKAEMEAGLESTQPGLQSRVVTAFIKELNPRLASTGVAMVFINQLRSQISFNRSVPTGMTTPGGRALKFYASLRLHLQLGKTLFKANEFAGEISGASAQKAVAHIVHVKATKNKLAVPYRGGDLLLVHGKGFRAVPSSAA